MGTQSISMVIHSKSEQLAVSAVDVDLYGCPYCGYRSFFSHVSDGRTFCCSCGECKKDFIVLSGVVKSTIGIGGREAKYPELSPHPRHGLPKHGRPDKSPPVGEFFSSRGIGMDSTPGCFLCGGPDSLRSNISGYVRCKASGERVVEMLGRGTRLDYREFEPDYVQVKIGACKKHIGNLERLHELTSKDGIISMEIVDMARKEQ